jgi:ABC-type dipeptide/oligopeptide/nickel transport system permease subunit
VDQHHLLHAHRDVPREDARVLPGGARLRGLHLRIIFRHLLPNCLTPLVTFTPFAVVGAIFALTGLDYLGYGLPAPTPSWGELIDQALQTENRRQAVADASRPSAR